MIEGSSNLTFTTSNSPKSQECLELCDLLVGLKFDFRKKKKYLQGGKKPTSLLQSAISLYISRIEYPHRSSRENFILCHPVGASVSLLGKDWMLEIWQLSTVHHRVFPPAWWAARYSNYFSPEKRWFFFSSPPVVKHSENRIHISDTFHKFFTSALMINSSQE